MEGQPGPCVVCLTRQGKHDLIATKIGHSGKHGLNMALKLQRLLAITNNDAASHNCDEVNALMPYLGETSSPWSSPSCPPGSAATDPASPPVSVNVPILPVPIAPAPIPPATHTKDNASVPPTPSLPDARFAIPGGSSAKTTPPRAPDWHTSPALTTGTSSPSPASPDTSSDRDRDHCVMMTPSSGTMPRLPPIVPLGAAPDFAPPLLSRGTGSFPRSAATSLANQSPSCLASPKFAPQPTINFEVAEPPRYPAWRQ